MSNPKNQKYFLDSWLKEPVFTDWLVKDKENTKARCSVCHKVIELSSSGRSALTDHAKGKKHQQALLKVQNFFKPRTSKVEKSATLTPSSSLSLPLLSSSQVAKEQHTIDAHLEHSSTTRAEIIWTLKSVMSGFSTRSSDDMSQTLCAMYPNVDEIKSFQMGRTKATYVINHGLAPYFKSLLKIYTKLTF